jgi:urea transport system permease protein
VKTLTFAVSAGMAGLAGALFVPVVGIISPALLGIVPSIELVVGVALGGRASLVGAILGVVLANYARTTFSEYWPDGWLYLQGALLILVIALAPKGIAGLVGRAGGLVASRRMRPRLRGTETSTPALAGEELV